MTTRFSWDLYAGGVPWLAERTIYVTLHGSHAYGTSVEGSDVDLRGVAIAPPEYYLGFTKHFEQATQTKPDLVIFELTKLMSLAADCNPNVLEILYTDEADHRVVLPVMQKLFAIRDRFLSKKAKHTFSGYAASQLRRIAGHHRMHQDPPTAPPTRAEFGLGAAPALPKEQLDAAEAAIRKRVDEWNWNDLSDLDPALRQHVKDEFFRRLFELTGVREDAIDTRLPTLAAKGLGYDTNFIELLDRERRYRSKLREWHQYLDWKQNRNEARAVLEAKYGYDVKHAMHLVRLLRMCREILTTGKVIVKRPDADELLAIRRGEMPYETLVAWAEKQDAELSELAKTSTLPKAPDREALDRVCIEMIREFL